MDLKDIRPVMGSFKLASTGDHEHHLRKFTLDDHIWLQEQTGKGFDEVSKLPFSEAMPIFMRISYRLLVDKAPFKKQEVRVVYDEDGNEVEEQMGGLKLFCTCVVGPKEQNDVLAALIKTLGVSSPLPQEKKKQKVPKE